MSARKHRTQSRTFIFAMVLALSAPLLAQSHREPGNVSSELVDLSIPHFDRDPKNEYERALDLLLLTQSGSNDEFNAYQNLMDMLRFKEDVEVVINRLGELKEESLSEGEKLRKDNLKENLERKKAELEDKPVNAPLDSPVVVTQSGSTNTSTSIRVPNSQASVRIPLPTPSLLKDSTSGRALPPVSISMGVGKGEPLPAAPVRSLAQVPSATPAAVAVNQNPALGSSAYNAPMLQAFGTAAPLNQGPEFDDGVFDLESARPATPSAEGLRGQSVSKVRVTGAGRPSQAKEELVSQPVQAVANFSPPQTDPGILKKIGQWMEGFEKGFRQRNSPTLADLSERAPSILAESMEKSKVPPSQEQAGQSSLSAFQAQMTAISQ